MECRRGHLVVLVVLCVCLVTLVGAQSSSCEGAAYIPPPYVEKVVGGTTVGKGAADDSCSGGSAASTYKITPTVGNRVTIKACGPLTADPYLRVTVFTNSCSATSCVSSQTLPTSHECVSDSERLQFEASESVYWIVVEGDSSPGQYSLSINEGYIQSPLPGCENAISIPGPYSPPISFYSSLGASSYDSDDDSQWVTFRVIDSFDYGNADISLFVVDEDDIPLEEETSGPGGSWDTRVLSGAILGGVTEASMESNIHEGSWSTVCNDLGYCSVVVAYEKEGGSIDVLQGNAAAGWRITYSAVGAGQIGVSVLDSSFKQDYFMVDFEDCSQCEAVVTFSDLSVGVDLSDLFLLAFGVIGTDFYVEVTEVAAVSQQSQRSAHVVEGVTLPCSGTSVTTELGWYKIYPSRGEVTVSTCNPDALFPTNIDVYHGQCSDLQCVSFIFSSSCSLGMTVGFNAHESMYYVVVSGRNGATGTYELTVEEELASFVSTWDGSVWSSVWHNTPTPVSWSDSSVWWNSPSPGSWGISSYIYGSEDYGNSCDNPIVATYGSSATTSNSGLHYSNLCGLYTSSGSAWFSFIPGSNDQVYIDTCANNFDTVLAVVTDCESLSCIAHNDDTNCGWGSSVTINVTGGREYLIFVAGYGSDHGAFVLNIQSTN